MKIAFAGGGSLGPVTPLLAVARRLKIASSSGTPRNDNVDFIWFGTADGPERDLIEKEGIKFFPITVAKFPRYPDMRWLTFPFDMMKAKREAREVLEKERPDAVVSAGGFTAVPVIREASKMGIPCAIHQLDALMSWSNKVVEKYCVSKTTSFARDGYDLIATPSRFSLNDLPEKHAGAKPVVFVVGGGTGSGALNGAISSQLDRWLAFADVMHATGAGKKGDLVDREGYTVRELFDQNEMKRALADADLVITRAGIGSLSDVASCSKAAIVVPIPNGQQIKNAEVFHAAKAGLYVRQDQEDFAGMLFGVAKHVLSDRVELQRLGETAHAFFQTDDGGELAERVIKIAA
ncbi:glycosyltransferase [Candidatus Uhrbacteria bacterium]|nr:glycosyltransferase [Candidatus Uhrbacteria bacterium]